MLFGINSVNLHEELINNDNVRQIRKKATISDPFILLDQLFVKNFRKKKSLMFGEIIEKWYRLKYLIPFVNYYNLAKMDGQSTGR